jgi:hypothetical protein
VGGFGDRGSGAGFVDEVLVGDAGGDERGDGEPVDAAGFAAAGVVDEADGVVGKQWVGSSSQLQVVADVAGGFSLVMPVMVRRTVMRCSSAARVPSAIFVARVGWPRSIVANGDSVSSR